MCMTACVEMHFCISSRSMKLSDEIKDIEKALKDDGLDLVAILQSARVDRSTWTRWKSGSVRGARYDTMSRVRDAIHDAKGRAGLAALEAQLPTSSEAA